ncbi:MAG: hypothetical protein V1673_02195 [Candidatus Omnitrophota bacterium]
MDPDTNSLEFFENFIFLGNNFVLLFLEGRQAGFDIAKITVRWFCAGFLFKRESPWGKKDPTQQQE